MPRMSVNKAIHSMNHPIPRQEDIKAKLAGAKVFSKVDFNKAIGVASLLTACCSVPRQQQVVQIQTTHYGFKASAR